MTSQKFIQILFVLVCLAVCQGTPRWHGADWNDDKSNNTVDPCKMFCCANGGVCKLDSDMMPMCECSGSWNGTHCEANPCDGMTCQNNGTCLVNMADGTAQCCCTSGFTGANCENAACNPIPACPANYKRLRIPVGVAGAGDLLESCYRVITAAAPVNYLGGSQLCAADNAAPVEFNIAGEFAAVSTLLTGRPGSFYTGHTDAFNPVTNVLVGVNSGVPAVGVVFPNGAGGAGLIDCGVISTVAAPTAQICAVMITTGVVCEISLAGATCVCPAGGGRG